MAREKEGKYYKTYRKALLTMIAISTIAFFLGMKEIRTDSTTEIKREKSVEDEYEVTIGDETFLIPIFVKAKGEKRESSFKEKSNTTSIKDDFSRFIKKKEKETRDQNEFILPEEYNGEEVTYKRKASNVPIILLFLGVALFGLIIYDGKKREEDERKRREKEIKRTYPKFVYILTTLLSSGISLRNAIERIVVEGLISEDELLKHLTMLRLRWNRGVSINEGLTRLSDEIAVDDYRKLTTLLIQNRIKGSDGLSEVLSLRLREAIDERLTLAREDAERTGGKLLITITGLLLVVIIILMGPAYLTMKTFS